MFRSSGLWQRMSKAQLYTFPWCQECDKNGIVVWADDADHIKAIVTHWHLRADPANLQSLCRTCHNKKTAAERA